MTFNGNQGFMIFKNTGEIIEYDPIQEPKQIEPAYMLNLEAKVKAIKRRLENRSENL
jgi:hypothetical protein